MTGIAFAQGAAASSAGGLDSFIPMLILNSCIAVWIFIDAKKRGLKDDRYYAVATFILGLFFVPVYFLIFRKNNINQGQTPIKHKRFQFTKDTC
ncbi:MAG: DUF2834 domain-containing protein [Candidatus Electrothrix sp. LOE2]|nr:DUF2834 domain-containing protein [Candidatus Electrothrix sp. LOE2]